MSLMTLDQIKAWAALLPQDFAAEIGEPEGSATEDLARISNALDGLKDSSAVKEFVEANQDAFIGIGRAGRIRFLAWYRGQGHADSARFLEALTEGDGEGGKGSSKVAPFFKSDMEAIAAALGRRMARGMVDTYTLDVITGASYEAAATMDMRGGGL